MTQRKPPGIPFRSWIDAHVRKAREDGDFDDLPGEGEPLRDLDEAYDPAWWAKKLVKRERISVLPPQLEIRAEVEKTLATLAALESETRVRERIDQLNDKIRRLNSLASHGPPTTQAALDPEAVVARWREEREE